SQCKNNLKQIGLALHNYHDNYRMLPPGYVDTNKNSGSVTEDGVTIPGHFRVANWAWTAFIMPFLDQGPAYDKVNVNKNMVRALADPAKLQIIQAALPVFRCPSDDGPNLNANVNDRRFRDTINNKNVRGATNNYVAVNSSNEVRPLFGNVTSSSNHRANGAFFRNSSTAFRNIKDGTSNTMLVGERIYEKSDGSNNRPYAGLLWGINGRFGGSNSNMASAHGGGLRKLNCPENNACRRAFLSHHQGGVHFLFADGSVHFISENINHNTDWAVNSILEYLMAIKDGNPISDF
ncbi:MAG: DUF1559 domain-containing protein, partial [Planctomycetota bacterium]